MWWLYAVLILLSLLLPFNSDGSPDVNNISVSLTVLEVFLVVLAIGGFWVIRGEVRIAAQREARATVEELAPKYFAQVTRTMGAQRTKPSVEVSNEEEVLDQATEVTEDEGNGLG